MDTPMSGNQFLTQALKDYGVTHVFYLEAILKRTIRDLPLVGITPVMAHSEVAAGYMADGYARISGRPGFCAAQSIGTANLAAGLHDARLANTPVIAVTGRKPPQYYYRNSYQEAEHRLLYENLTKFNAEAVQPDQFPHILRQAFRAVSTGKPGPAHIDITNLAGTIFEAAEMNAEPAYTVDPIYGKYPVYRPAAEAERIAAAAAAIDAAEKPVLVVGRGAIVSGAKAEVYALATKADIPVTTSPDGKTVIDETDPIWAGIVGGYGMNCANQTVGAADLVIFLGTNTNDQLTMSWQIPAFATKTIQIDIDPTELGKNYPNCIGLCGDAKVVVAQLIEKVAQKTRPAWRAEVAAYLAETYAAAEQYVKSDAAPIRPERLCAEISKALPDNGVLVTDTGYSAIWGGTMVRMRATQNFVRAAGSLGWGFPGSLGVKCGAGDRPVVLLTGDGGFYYHLNEMETAARCGINTVTVVNNNQMLSQCREGLSYLFKGREEEGLRRISFSDLNLAKIAEEFGCLGIRVTKPEDIGPAIQKGLASGKPTIVEVMTDPFAEPQVAFVPK